MTCRLIQISIFFGHAFIWLTHNFNVLQDLQPKLHSSYPSKTLRHSSIEDIYTLELQSDHKHLKQDPGRYIFHHKVTLTDQIHKKVLMKADGLSR